MLDHRGFKGRRRLLGEQRGTYDDVHMSLNITLFIVIDKKTGCVCTTFSF